MLAPVINYFRSHSAADIIFREVTGNNLPHMAIIRNKDEFVDQSICQIGNTIAAFGGGFLLDKTINGLVKTLGLKINPQNQKWFFLGKSFSVLAMFSAILLAMPFLRNYVTTRRTGSDNYAEIVGEKQRQRLTEEELRRTLKEYKKRFLQILAGGAALSGTLLLGTLMLLKRNPSFPRLLESVYHRIGLEGGRFGNLKPLTAVLFWTIPTFSGFFLASRDKKEAGKYELKELALRFAAFNLAFFIFPHTIERGIDWLTSNLKPTRFLGPAKNVAYLGKFLSSFVFCSSIPSLVNIYLTRQRVKRDQAKQKQNPAFPAISGQPLNRHYQDLILSLSSSIPGSSPGEFAGFNGRPFAIR